MKTLSFTKFGPGDVLLFLLGPSVVSLAVQMFSRRKLMKENFLEVAVGTSSASFLGVYGTALFAKVLDIQPATLKLSTVSRQITSPLAMSMASMLKADVSIAVSLVVLTGLLGANFGPSLLNLLKINDPATRGITIGASSHGLGTAAMNDEKDAFPFSAISMALCGTISTVIVAIPATRNALLAILK